MRGFRAAIYKDIRLFIRSGGIAAFIIPFVLGAALYFGMQNSEDPGIVQPFPIAINDEDKTMMSRSLISQIRSVPMFSEVWVIDEEENQDALEKGAAGVITIPKDFFYAMYTAEDDPVELTLNENMKRDSVILESVLSSVMNIVSSDQAANYGLFQYLYKSPSEEQKNQLYQETSIQLFHDALGRQNIFDTDLISSDTVGSLYSRIASSALTVLFLCFAMIGVRTISEELDLDILQRFRLVGGNGAAFIFSKYLVCAVMSLPYIGILLILDPMEGWWRLLIIALLVLALCFFEILCIAILARNTQTIQRCGCLLLLISLVCGGTFWPLSALPAALSVFGKWTIPFLLTQGIKAVQAGESISSWLGLYFQSLLAAFLFFFAFWGILRITRRAGYSIKKRRSLKAVQVPDSRKPIKDIEDPKARAECRKPGFPARQILCISRMKLLILSGGRAGFLITLLLVLVLGSAVYAAQRNSLQQISIAVVDKDQSDASDALEKMLEETPSLHIYRCDNRQAENFLNIGNVEGILTIKKGYRASLGSEEGISLHYVSSFSSYSTQAVREIIAGLAIGQDAEARAVVRLEEALGRTPKPQETTKLLDLIQRNRENLPALYHVSQEAGKLQTDPFVPDSFSFAAAAIMIITLMMGGFTKADDAVQVARRMRSLPWGRLLSLGSDLLALCINGILLMILILLPGGMEAAQITAILCYAFCVSGLSLFMARVNPTECGIDVLVPFSAMIFCLVGGCFMDPTLISDTAARWMMLSPAGLARMATEMLGMHQIVLLAEGVIFIMMAQLLQK